MSQQYTFILFRVCCVCASLITPPRPAYSPPNFPACCTCGAQVLITCLLNSVEQLPSTSHKLCDLSPVHIICKRHCAQRACTFSERWSPCFIRTLDTGAATAEQCPVTSCQACAGRAQHWGQQQSKCDQRADDTWATRVTGPVLKGRVCHTPTIAAGRHILVS